MELRLWAADPKQEHFELRFGPAAFGLIDCDNFYVSCERVFRPDLAGVPVIVLSNNDGCAVARSADCVESAQASNFGRPLQVIFVE